jgi:tetratricopeptide (TPR) repeat protein
MFNDTAIMKGNMGSMKASGKSYNVTDVLVFKFNQDGKIIEQRFILPYSEIRRQVKVGVEYDLNSAGYELIRANKLNDAIEIFKTNVKLYPTSFNTYDSLGEAYALAGNKKLAIENYEKAIKINPSHEYGKKMLSKLKAK